MIFPVFRSVSCFVLSIMLAGKAYSQNPVTVDSAFKTENIGTKIEYIIDSQDKLTLKDVRNRSDWISNDSKYVHLGFTTSVCWFRFAIKNATDIVSPLVLEIDYPHLYDITFYRPGLSGDYESIRTGTDFGFETREIPDRNFKFSISLPRRTNIYYLRIRTGTPLNFSPTLYSQKAFYNESSYVLLVHWIYMGLLFSVTFFGFFMFAFIRKPVYLYGAFFSLFMFLTAAHFNGFAFQFLWRSQTHLGQKCFFISGCLVVVFFVQFTRIYIGTRALYPVFDRILGLMAVLVGPILCLAIVFFDTNVKIYFAIAVWIMFVVAIIMPLLVHGLLKKSFRSVHMLVGFSFFLTGVILYLLKDFSVIPLNDFTNWSMQFTSTMFLITYALALPFQMSFINNEVNALNVELQQSQYYLKLAQEISSLGSWSYDVATGKRQWSSGFENILNIKNGDFSLDESENPIDIFVHPDDRDSAKKIVRKVIREGEYPPFECRVITSDGRTRWVLAVVRLVKDRMEHRALFGTVQDITERKMMEEELEKKNRELGTIIGELQSSNDELAEINEQLVNTQVELMESEDRFRRFAEKAQDVLYRYSFTKNGFDFVNDAIEKVTGYASAEFCSNPALVREITHPESYGYYEARAVEIQNGYFPENYLLCIIHKCGEQRWVQMHNILIKDKKGIPLAIEGIARDITEQKRAENQLKSSLHEKEILLKEIHHRVKNNMQVIISLLNLQSGYVSNEHDRQLFVESQNRVLAMAMVHQKMYQSENLGRINFRDYLADLARELSVIYSIDDENLKIVIDADDAFLGVDLAIPIALIVNELVTNSLKHAFPGGGCGEIKVAFRQEEDAFQISVSDSGIGLPDSVRLDRVQTLGLELIHALSAQLRGSVAMETKPGTKFTIRFPR